MSVEKIKTLIIGSGPAGYTAAIYASRADLKPVLYTGLEPGGQLTTTTEVDNFPGYPDGVDGPTMMVELQKQAERFGTDVRIGLVTSVVQVTQLEVFTKLLLITTKKLRQRVLLSLPNSCKVFRTTIRTKTKGGGVSACAVCDGFFYKGQDVAIVGGGDTAAEEATYLSNICTKVTMIVRKGNESFKGNATQG